MIDPFSIQLSHPVSEVAKDKGMRPFCCGWPMYKVFTLDCPAHRCALCRKLIKP